MKHIKSFNQINENLSDEWRLVDVHDVPAETGTYVVIPRHAGTFSMNTPRIWVMPDEFNKMLKFEFYRDFHAYKKIDNSDLYKTALSIETSPAKVNPHKWD